MVLLQLGKEIQAGTISELSSSSPESGESSLSNGHSLSDVISDWKRELEEKNCALRDKIAVIHSLENQLKLKDSEIFDVNDRCKSVELDRDKNCQMVSEAICPVRMLKVQERSRRRCREHFSIFKIFMHRAHHH